MKVYNQAAAAGLGNYLSDNGDYDYEEIEFLSSDVPDDADFGIRISGDSMEPEIQDGDIVWVKSQPEIDNGQIGIFIVEDDAYCKRLQKIRGDVRLVSSNEKYDDIRITEGVRIKTMGRVLATRSENVVYLPYAARSTSDKPPQMRKFTREELDSLKTLESPDDF